MLAPLNVGSLDHIFLLIIHLSSRLQVITGSTRECYFLVSQVLPCNVTIANLQCP